MNKSAPTYCNFNGCPMADRERHHKTSTPTPIIVEGGLQVFLCLWGKLMDVNIQYFSGMWSSDLKFRLLANFQSQKIKEMASPQPCRVATVCYLNLISVEVSLTMWDTLSAIWIRSVWKFLWHCEAMTVKVRQLSQWWSMLATRADVTVFHLQDPAIQQTRSFAEGWFLAR